MCISFYNLLVGLIGISRGKESLTWIHYDYHQKCLSISFGVNVMYLDKSGGDHKDYRCYPKSSFPQDFISLIRTHVVKFNKCNSDVFCEIKCNVPSFRVGSQFDKNKKVIIDSNKIQSYLKSKEVLLQGRESEGSPLYKDIFPLDLFKIIYNLSFILEEISFQAEVDQSKSSQEYVNFSDSLTEDANVDTDFDMFMAQYIRH